MEMFSQLLLLAAQLSTTAKDFVGSDSPVAPRPPQPGLYHPGQPPPLPAPPPPLIPRRELFGPAERGSPKLSPDGRWIAFGAPLDGVMNVWVQRVDRLLDGQQAIAVTRDTGRGIFAFSWTWLSGVMYYAKDDDGDENYRLYKLDVTEPTLPHADLATPGENVRVQVLKTSRKHPETIIVGLNERDPSFHDAYRLELTSLRLTLIHENVDGLSRLIFDDEYQLRLGVRTTDDGGEQYLLYEPSGGGGSNWTLYKSIPFQDSATTSLVSFDSSNKRAYWTNGTNTDLPVLVLETISADPADWRPQTLYTPEKTEFSVILHPIERTLQAVEECYGRCKLKVINDTFGEVHRFLQQRKPEAEVSIISHSRDLTINIVAYAQDDRPVEFYLFNRNSRRIDFLYTPRPWLLKYKFSKMHPIEVRSRDGLLQLCYLTLPPEMDVAGTGRPPYPVPLILFVHGGPWARDSWGFSNRVQLIANRGYAVLQCNYRGSAGFGKAHLNAGNGEWSGRMHDDLLDAVDWAVDNRITSRDTVAIYGGSYGGYAALVGLTFTPDVFRCGVDVVGRFRFGFINKSQAFLRDRSPLFRAERVTAPLLIAQGANDPRVKKNESDQFVSAMNENDIPVTYVLFPDEGHGFDRPQNRLAFQAVSEKFLADCLQGRYEPVGSAFDGSSIEIIQEA